MTLIERAQFGCVGCVGCVVERIADLTSCEVVDARAGGEPESHSAAVVALPTAEGVVHVVPLPAAPRRPRRPLRRRS